jgi:adenosylhomocysteine nucleosidase
LFPVDRGLWAAASKVASDANSPGSGSGRVISAGTGVSGPVFVANRDYRIWLSEAWQAEVVDLESTAVAQVCWANRVPFIAVRAVAGLAGSPLARPPEEPPVDRAARVLLAMLTVLPD